MSSLTDWKKYNLLPILWRRLDDAFPELELVFRGGVWYSNTKRHLDGTEATRKGRIYAKEDYGAYFRDQTSEKIDFVTYAMESRNLDTIGAFKYLATACGIELPDNMSKEQVEAIQSRRNALEKANSIFVEALWDNTNSEALKVLDYLRNERKWTDEEIREASLGFVNEEIKKSLPTITFTDDNGVEQSIFTWVVGKYYRLTIPYRSGGLLYGFSYRVDSETEPILPENFGKYYHTNKMPRSANLLGLQSSASTKTEDIVVVEGTLDAIHAKVKGIRNVVATSGGKLTDLAIKDALKAGYRNFNLLFDMDERGQGFIVPSAEAVAKEGGKVYISRIPKGQGKDLNEYLIEHSVEDYKRSIVGKAMPYYAWQYNNLVEAFPELPTFKEREELIEKVIALATAQEPTDREFILSAFIEEGDRFGITEKGIRETAEAIVERDRKAERKEAVVKAQENAKRLIEEGRIEEAVKVMGDTAKTLTYTSDSDKYARAFAPLSAEEMEKELGEINEGLPTGIIFQDRGLNVREELTLNTGMTFICAYRGHGKTSFLNNLALNETTRNLKLANGKAVLYFSYEIDRRRLVADLLNTFVNDAEMSKINKPLNAIIDYFKGKGDRYFKNGHYEGFLAKKNEFLRSYLASGALLPIYENYTAEELEKAIRYYIKQREVSAVFIDYAQLLYSEEYSRQRTEEIKAIVNRLKNLANEVNVPIVLACQFNREVYSPYSVDSRNIGEGGDYERIADTCIGLFNLKELKEVTGNNAKIENFESKAILGKLLGESIDTLQPIQGKIFVRLMKKRYGYYPLDCVLDWEGRTKYIRPNYPEALEIKQPTLIEDDLP